MDNKLFDEALELYNTGLKGKDIEDKLGIKRTTFFYNLKLRGFKPRPKGSGRIVSHEVKKKMSETMLGSNNPNFNKYEQWMEKGLVIGQKRIFTKEEKKIVSDKAKKRWCDGIYDSNNYGGNAKIYIIDGRKCKGKNEYNYIIKNKEKFPLILNKVEQIKTPHGVYTPDFDMNGSL